MMTLFTIASLVLLPALGSGQGTKPTKPTAPPTKPAPAPDKAATAAKELAKELAELAKNLDGADAKKAEELVFAFAGKHRPTKGSAEFMSDDKSLQIVLAANGSEKSPKGENADLTPKGSKVSVAIAGNGWDAAAGDGGQGGEASLKANETGKIFLFGGRGGKGADGKAGKPAGKGGEGGKADAGKFAAKESKIVAKPGAGGPGGKGEDKHG